MAKWIYERWEPAWVIPTYDSSTAHRATEAYLVNYDLTVIPEARRIDSLKEGDIYVLNLNPGARYQYLLSLFVYNQPGFVSRISYPTGVAPSVYKKAHLSTVVAEEGTYPDDGVHSDQLYYVKIKKAFPTMRILRDGQWAEVETGYVLKDGVWKPIEEIYKLQNGQWVQA